MLCASSSSLVPVKMCVPTHPDGISAESFICVPLFEQFSINARLCKGRRTRRNMRRILDFHFSFSFGSEHGVYHGTAVYPWYTPTLTIFNRDSSKNPLELPAAPGGGPITGRGSGRSAFGPAFEGGMLEWFVDFLLGSI